ncbi:MAG: hypothetical protein D6701_04965 [Gemmatimonadetes bacterium]|nr:MAG: hypothetical protein D6701_04965 [Gemmatimonadota bacterium]
MRARTGSLEPSLAGERRAGLVERLRAAEPLVAVELRPPRADLAGPDGMDAWIDVYHSVQRLARRDRFVCLTDDAVGTAEEENLAHLATNLGPDAPRSRLVPFLTCKHTREYCLLYADRAASLGFETLVVLGGDRSVGPPRCVPHAADLRRLIRERRPELALGGWANPHRPVAEQVGFMLDRGFCADFYLTQVVSHHSIARVEAFLDEADRRGMTLPGAFGVFFYRSANPRTLEVLGDFFPVPAEALSREFEAGVSPEEVCARTIRALRAAGARHVYVSNLGHRNVERRLADILERV